jgi:hypothetical protein
MRYTALLLVLSAIAGWAANTTPVAPEAPTDAIPVAQYINYQGVMTPNPGAWTGTFTIWDDPTSINPVNQFWSGQYSFPSDPNGLYSVQLGSPPASPITALPEGPNCWLEIDINGTPLSPRTQLVTVPYAWNAAGLTSNQHGICRANVSNVLYGSDAAKSTHVNLGNYSTTGTSGQDYLGCTVGGGDHNTSSDYYATVGGGTYNVASNHYATVGGGTYNVASDNGCTVGGGVDNAASNGYSTVGGGAGNTASLAYATVGGGDGNRASGATATVGGGAGNWASGDYATVPGGHSAFATHTGQMAYAGACGIGAPGQTSLFVMGSTSPNPTELFLDGVSDRLTVAVGQRMIFEVQVVGGDAAGNSAGYCMKGIIENIGGTTNFVGAAPTTEVLGEDVPAWDATVSASDVCDALVVTVTGSGTIRWAATVHTTEVTF